MPTHRDTSVSPEDNGVRGVADWPQKGHGQPDFPTRTSLRPRTTVSLPTLVTSWPSAEAATCEQVRPVPVQVGCRDPEERRGGHRPVLGLQKTKDLIELFSCRMGTFPSLGGVGHGAWDISGHPWKQPCPPVLVARSRGSGSTTPQIPLRTAICDFLVEMAKEWKPRKLMILMEKTDRKPLLHFQKSFQGRYRAS